MKTILAPLCAILLFSTTSWGGTLNDSYWKVKLSDNTNLLLKLSLSNDRFTLASRNHSSHNVVGWKYTFARITGKVGAHCIEATGKYRIANDTIFLTGLYKSLTSTQAFDGYIAGDSLRAVLSKNRMNGCRSNDVRPLKDYPSIARAAVDTTEKYLFNPTILKSREWQRFKKDVLQRSRDIIDDYEFEKMFNFRVGKLPFTHYGISLNPPRVADSQQMNAAKPQAKPSKFAIKQLTSATALLEVKTFSASAEEIMPYIDTLKAMHMNNLIVDLRSNGGGTIASAMPLARFLVKDTLMGGIFLTQKYFKQHTKTPDINEYSRFTHFSEASFPLIISGIHNHEGLCLVVYPDKVTFTGSLYILVNGGTASTCEPLVYALKAAGRATIVGEKTYGGMLNGERFALPSGCSLWLPTADYYAADGYKIDKNGVDPDIQVKSADALGKALEAISKAEESKQSR